MHDFLNGEGSIPRLLPASTLACPPSTTYISQFHVEKFSPRIKDVSSYAKEEAKKDSDANPTLKTAKPDSARYKGPKVWVKKWVDYSSKYGLGYLLSNVSTGVFFNDSTKIVLDTDCHNFIYYFGLRHRDDRKSKYEY